MDEQSLRELCNLQGAQAPASPLAVELHSKMASHDPRKHPIHRLLVLHSHIRNLALLLQLRREMEVYWLIVAVAILLTSRP